MNFRARLTLREGQILLLIKKGKSNSEIAEALDITVGTTKIHIHNIYTKLGVVGQRARGQLIASRVGQ